MTFTPDHIHVERNASDCDGRSRRHWTCELDELTPKQLEDNAAHPDSPLYDDDYRLAQMIARELSYSIAARSELPTVTYETDGSIGLAGIWEGEGGWYENWAICTDEFCDENDQETTYRDFSAEAAGY